MQFVTGMIVRSKQGRDNGKFYVVLSADKTSALLYDADKRTIKQPKKKNLRHLAPTKTVLSAKVLGSDSEIRRTLAEFQRKATISKEVI
jgi:ribosomal protein L14E/L6E/L27E